MKKAYRLFFYAVGFGLTAPAGWARGRETPAPALWSAPDFHYPGTTAAGKTEVSSRTLRGRPWIADFIFTHCGGPCPFISSRISALQKELPAEVRFVSFTVDPARDTLPVLKAYAARFKADPERWLFVRPDPAALTGLVREGFKLPVRPDPAAPSGARVVHSTKLVLVDAQGQVRAFFDSESETLADDITNALRKH